MEALASTLGLNGPELATIVSADIIVVVTTAIVNLVLLRSLTRDQSRFPRADLEMYYGMEKTVKRVTSLELRVSNEEGEDTAPLCKAMAVFVDIEKRDIVDHHAVNALYTSSNFHKTLRVRLLWSKGEPRCTLASGDDGFDNPLEIMRLVPTRGSIPAHFEIPCVATRGITTAVCLQPKHYYGKVQIHPARGKYRKWRFSTFRDEFGNWYFKCGLFDAGMRGVLS